MMKEEEIDQLNAILDHSEEKNAFFPLQYLRLGKSQEGKEK